MRNSRRIVLLILGMFPLMSTLAFSVPGLINYKGQLTDASGNPLTGPVDITFTFWDLPTSGTQLGAGFSDPDAVTPNADGIYDTLIGDLGYWISGGFVPPLLIPDSVFRNPYVFLNVNIEGEDLSPRTFLAPVGAAMHAGSADTATMAEDADTVDGLDASAFIESTASSYVVVKPTDNAVTNGTKLVAAYATARALTPHGQALETDNRAVLLVPPGKYDLGTGQLEMDTEFVDLVGLSSARENQHIYGTANGYGTGVLRQTAYDVKIENLFVELKSTGLTLNHDDQDPAAYFPDTKLDGTVVRNCVFRGQEQLYGDPGWIEGAWAPETYSMRLAVEYVGHYEDCNAGHYSFGYGLGGAASGTFINCTGGGLSFGAKSHASGTFINCTGWNWSFGHEGNASGTFTNCTARAESFGDDGTASGTFTNCTGGNYSFGTNGDATGGKFYFCSAGTNSFSGTGGPTIGYCLVNGVPYP